VTDWLDTMTDLMAKYCRTEGLRGIVPEMFRRQAAQVTLSHKVN
jgi:hypothetical protein